jgi:archaemetzincin
MQVMTHEIGHMFGIEHCVHYACNMNGSNNLQESDRQPAHVCPVCLRKLQHAIGFDPASRYDRLAAFYDRVGMKDDAAFARLRLSRIRP